jgi:NADPH:quinone reductase-like Zn-dependent oxidoreductase
VYGNLSKDKMSDIDPFKLIYHEMQMNGFQVDKWFNSKNFIKRWWIMKKVKNMFKNYPKFRIQKEFPLKDIFTAIDQYEHHMGEGKVILKPWGFNSSESLEKPL